MSPSNGPRSASGGVPTKRHYNQRCAVRVTYAKNTRAGQWRAHGRYLARESATLEGDSRRVGFDKDKDDVDIASQLHEWQQSGDERLWKLIVSPEFAERIDLKQLTRELIARMEAELDTTLQWTAAAHYNTEHPHVHVALRGIDSKGQPLKLDRNFIKHGIREIAEDLCTRQLGYRTEMDAASAERREVSAARFTSLDRAIQRGGVPEPASPTSEFVVTANVASARKQSTAAKLRDQHIAERLQHLSTMGLAQAAAPGIWRVKEDFEQVLRAMQKANDRQRMLAAHGVLMSDERLPVEVLNFRKLKSIEGRVLLHGEEEQGRSAGRAYLLLESTDARVHYVYYTPEIEEARSRGMLRTNSFARLRR
jgi:type IV secretory pathway VirD2 relaxase